MTDASRMLKFNCALAMVLLAVLVFSLYHLNAIGGIAQSIHDDRIVPLTQLKQISDGYAINLIDTINKANAGLLEPAAVQMELTAVAARSEELWQSFLSSQLTEQEQRLVVTVATHKMRADAVIAELSGSLATMTAPLTGKLNQFDGPIYQTIDPLTATLAELSRLQLTVATANRQDIGQRARQVRWVLGTSAAITLLALLVVAGLFALQQRTRRRLAELAASQQQVQQFNQVLAQQVAVRADALQQAVQELDQVKQQLATRESGSPLQARSVTSDDGETVEPPIADDWLRQIERATLVMDQMNRLIIDLLGLSRLGRSLLQPQPIELHELAAELLSEYPADHGARIALQSLPTAYADRSLLRQLLQQLIDCALAQSARGAATVTIATRRDPAGGLAVMVGANSMESAIDSMTASGLAIGEKIVQLHGGRLWTESVSGQGNCLCFSLPTMQLNAAPA